MILSFLLVAVGAATHVEACLAAGVVFFICNAGTLAGVYCREKKRGRMDKVELRAAMKALNRALPDEERRAVSARIFGAVARSAEFAAARCVGVFCALPDEPDTAAALSSWSREKRIVVPRVEGDSMQFYDYDPAVMVRGAFGIAEPGPDAVLCPPGEIDFVVVPGVAFTPDGARLGRGRGFYDRYLSQPGVRAFKAGVCYPHQLTDALPAEPHDVAMDRIFCGR